MTGQARKTFKPPSPGSALALLACSIGRFLLNIFENLLNLSLAALAQTFDHKDQLGLPPAMTKPTPHPLLVEKLDNAV